MSLSRIIARLAVRPALSRALQPARSRHSLALVNSTKSLVAQRPVVFVQSARFFSSEDDSEMIIITEPAEWTGGCREQTCARPCDAL